MSMSEYEINPHEAVEAYKEEATQSYVAHRQPHHHRGGKVIAHLSRESVSHDCQHEKHH